MNLSSGVCTFNEALMPSRVQTSILRTTLILCMQIGLALAAEAYSRRLRDLTFGGLPLFLGLPTFPFLAEMLPPENGPAESVFTNVRHQKSELRFPLVRISSKMHFSSLPWLLPSEVHRRPVGSPSRLKNGITAAASKLGPKPLQRFL
jgi:hypothetical protein